jgi:hypothetical protein
MAEYCHAECGFCWLSLMLNVTYKPFMLSAIMLSVVVLSVVAPKWRWVSRFIRCYAECRVLFFVMLSVIMLNVIIISVAAIFQSVYRHTLCIYSHKYFNSDVEFIKVSFKKLKNVCLLFI